MLKRELGVVDAMMMGLGSILGMGIFVSIGLAAGITGLLSCARLAFWVDTRVWLAGIGIGIVGLCWFGVARAMGRNHKSP